MEKSSDLENNPISHSSSDPYGHTDMPNLEVHTDEFPHLCVPFTYEYWSEEDTNLFLFFEAVRFLFFLV